MARPTLLPRQQRGVAAIEFTLIAMMMVIMLLGILVYWRAFQAHQSLTRAAGDGSRVILGMVITGMDNPCSTTNSASNRTNIQDRVQQTATRSLTLSHMPDTELKSVSQRLTISTITWPDECPSLGSTITVSFQLSYELPPLLGTTPLLGEPTHLSEKSVVHFASMR